MTRYLMSAAAVVLLYASPVLAADTMKPSSPPGGANAAGQRHFERCEGAKLGSPGLAGGKRSFKQVLNRSQRRYLYGCQRTEFLTSGVSRRNWTAC